MKFKNILTIWRSKQYHKCSETKYAPWLRENLLRKRRKLMNLLVRFKVENLLPLIPMFKHHFTLKLLLSTFHMWMLHRYSIDYILMHVWTHHMYFYCLYNISFWGSNSDVSTILQLYYRGTFWLESLVYKIWVAILRLSYYQVSC